MSQDNCSHDEIIYDASRGEIICAKCGLVLSERVIDVEHYEDRIFNFDELLRKSRTSKILLTMHNYGLTTISADKNITRKMNYIIYLRDKFMVSMFKLLHEYARKFNISKNELGTAALLLRNLIKEKRGLASHFKEVVIIACIIKALQFHNPVKQKEFEEKIIHELNHKERKILRKLLLRLSEYIKVDVRKKTSVYIDYLTNKLNLENKVNVLAHKLSKLVENHYKPEGVAAAAVYVAALLNKKHITMKTLCNLLNITDMTLRKYKHIIVEKMGLMEFRNLSHFPFNEYCSR